MSAPLNALVVMGVSGCGKTTLAAALGARLRWPWRDADDMHPRENVEKMRAGQPLDDADRAPWLAAIAAWIDAERARGGHAIIACSALKRAYRDVLIGPRADVGLIFLDGPRELIHDRMAARAGHYMPAALLDSQIATLEPPTPDEGAIRLAITNAPEQILAQALAALAPRVPGVS